MHRNRMEKPQHFHSSSGRERTTRVYGGMRIPMRCRKFDVALADYFEGGADSEVDEHLAHCSVCRAALDDSRIAGDLLREVWVPATEPRQEFRAGVWSKIREEQSRSESTAAFWGPIELLASRLALTAAVALIAMSAYLFEIAPRRTPRPLAGRTELSDNDFPQPPRDPVSNEEVLQSLAENKNGD